MATAPPPLWTNDPDYIAATQTTILPGGPTAYVPPRPGHNTADVTDFMPGQALWAKNDLPDIIYTLRPPPAWQAFKIAPKPPAKIDPVTGLTMFELWPLTPASRRPLLDFRVLPDRIGSKEDWWVIEAWRRLDPRVAWSDIEMRMSEPRPTGNTIQTRLGRIRPDYFLLTWHTMQHMNGGSAKNDDVLRRLPQLQHDNNTTRGCTPGLINPAAGEAGGRIPFPHEPARRDGPVRRTRRQPTQAASTAAAAAAAAQAESSHAEDGEDDLSNPTGEIGESTSSDPSPPPRGPKRKRSASSEEGKAGTSSRPPKRKRGSGSNSDQESRSPSAGETVGVNQPRRPGGKYPPRRGGKNPSGRPAGKKPRQQSADRRSPSSSLSDSTRKALGGKGKAGAILDLTDQKTTGDDDDEEQPLEDGPNENSSPSEEETVGFNWPRGKYPRGGLEKHRIGTGGKGSRQQSAKAPIESIEGQEEEEDSGQDSNLDDDYSPPPQRLTTPIVGGSGKTTWYEIDEEALRLKNKRKAEEAAKEGRPLKRSRNQPPAGKRPRKRNTPLPYPSPGPVASRAQSVPELSPTTRKRRLLKAIKANARATAGLSPEPEPQPQPRSPPRWTTRSVSRTLRTAGAPGQPNQESSRPSPRERGSPVEEPVAEEEEKEEDERHRVPTVAQLIGPAPPPRFNLGKLDEVLDRVMAQKKR